MELIIYGTKDGHRILYESNRSSSSLIAYDKRTGSKVNSDEQYGKFIYSIVLTPDGEFYFSKYLIIQDSLRSFSVGYIAFAIYLSANEKMNGEDILKFLDAVSNVYKEEYIRENCINRGENDLIREDTSLFENIKNKFEADKKLNNFKCSFPSTRKDPAFIAYDTTQELIDHFNNPFQEKFLEFKEILFVDRNLISNNIAPLNLLQNSGEELASSSLRGKSYFLKRSSLDQNLILFKNREPLINDKDFYIIGDDDLLELKYEKKHHESFSVSGSLKEINSNINKYIEIKDSQISIKQEELLKNSSAIEKSFVLIIKDRNNRSHEGAKVECVSLKNQNRNLEKDGKLIFRGDEIGRHWEISARSGENFWSDKISFYPELENELVIKLKEQRKIDFYGFSDKGKEFSLPNIKITVKGKTNNSSDKQVIFIDDEIDRNYEVEGNCIFDGDYYEGKETFCPSDQNEVSIIFRKIKKKRYKIHVNQYGEIKSGTPGWSNDVSGSDIKNYIRPIKGYKFYGFEYEDYSGQEDFDGVLNAKFKKVNPFGNAKIIAGAVVLVFLIVFASFLAWSFYGKNPKEKITKEKIDDYLQGVELQSDQLKKYEDFWKEKEPFRNQEKSFLSNLLFFRKKNTVKDSSEYKKWQGTKVKIDSANYKRLLVNEFKFIELKEFYYSEKQQDFLKTVEKIDSTNLELLKSQLGDTDFKFLGIDEINDVLIDKLEQILNPTNSVLAYLDGTDLRVDSLETLRKNSIDENINKRLETAIKFRQHLNKGEITNLQKLNFSFSENQSRLKEAINAINEKNKRKIGDALNRGKTSQMGLNEVAEIIESLTEKSNSDGVEEVKSSNENNVNVVTPRVNNVESVFIKQLQGKEVSKNSLEYIRKQSPNPQEIKSIELYLNFWATIIDNKETIEKFKELLNEIKSDSILKNSDLKKFLETISKDVQTFESRYKSKKYKIQRRSDLDLKTLENFLQL